MAIATVGGICPGLNDVIRSLVHKVCVAGAVGEVVRGMGR